MIFSKKTIRTTSIPTSTPSDGPPLRFKTINLIQITKINLNKTMYDWFPGKVQKLKKEENKKQRKT